MKIHVSLYTKGQKGARGDFRSPYLRVRGSYLGVQYENTVLIEIQRIPTNVRKVQRSAIYSNIVNVRVLYVF